MKSKKQLQEEILQQDKLWKIYELAIKDLKWAKRYRNFKFDACVILDSNNCKGCLGGAMLIRRFNPDKKQYVMFPKEIEEDKVLFNKMCSFTFDLVFGNIYSAYKIFYNTVLVEDLKYEEPDDHQNYNLDAYLEYSKGLLNYLKEKDI